jgi:hypothetical protein
MPPKKGDQAKSSNRIRFIMLDADISDGNLSELTQAITNALKPSGFRPLAAQAPVKAITAGKEAGEDTEETAEEPIEAEFEEPTTNGDAPRAPRPTRQKKSKAPNYLHDLIKDSDALKTFAAEKNPSSKLRQYLTAMYWLKEVNGTPMINIDAVYTFYKTAGWSVGFNDWAQPFHNLVHDDLIRKGDVKGEFTINPTGEDVVKSLPE